MKRLLNIRVLVPLLTVAFISVSVGLAHLTSRTLAHERSKAILSRRGIDFEVDDRAPVVASAKGIVKYAGDIRGLDRGVIVDHGDYFTVVGKLGEITVPIGATVEAGDRIGRAAKHRVYLEVRVRVGGSGMLVDPEPLLATKK